MTQFHELEIVRSRYWLFWTRYYLECDAGCYCTFGPYLNRGAAFYAKERIRQKFCLIPFERDKENVKR